MVKMAKLALEDGTVLKGDGFGYETTKVGELFNWYGWLY